MAKTTVSIIFKGIGYFYQDGSQWKVLLPFDDCHNVKFLQKKILNAPIQPAESDTGPWAQAGRRLTTDVSGSSTVSGDTGIAEFLDIGSAFHDSGLSFKSGWRSKAVEVTLNNAIISQAALTQHYFMLCEPIPPALGGDDMNVIVPASKVGKSIKAETELDAGGKMLVTFIDSPSVTRVGYFSFVDSGETRIFQAFVQDDNVKEYQITIDNDCDAASGENDFNMLYNILEDTGVSGRKCSVEFLPDQHRNGTPIWHEAGGILVFDDPDYALNGTFKLADLRDAQNNASGVINPNDMAVCHLFPGPDPGNGS